MIAQKMEFFNLHSKYYNVTFITKNNKQISDAYLFKDRAKGEYEYKALEKTKYKKLRDLLNENFSIDNVYWLYIENIITEEYTKTFQS